MKNKQNQVAVIKVKRKFEGERRREINDDIYKLKYWLKIGNNYKKTRKI